MKKNRLSKLCSAVLAICLLTSSLVVSTVTKANTSDGKKNINILLIGNSYAADTVNYLAEIYDSAGYDSFNIVSLYYPGATLSRIYEELILSKTAADNNFADRDSGVYKFNALLTTERNTGVANNKETLSRNASGCFAYQKYTKENGAVKSHQTVYNYDLGKAIDEAAWDVVSIQNINNTYDATEEAAYTVQKAGTDSTYGDYSTAFTFYSTTYYAGKEYIGKEYVNILTDYIKTKNSNAKVFFNSTWVPEYSAIRNNATANNHTPKTAQKDKGNFSQGYSAYEWEQELDRNVYKYLTDKTENNNVLSGIVKNNVLVEYLYENLPMISDTYSLWRDNTHLIDIGRYAVALNYYYTVSGVDFADANNRIAFVPSFEIKENLSVIYDCLALANSADMPQLSTVKYYDASSSLLKTEYYFVGSTVKLYHNGVVGSYPAKSSGSDNDFVKMEMPVTESEYNLYFKSANADVSAKKAIADSLPEYITLAEYDKVTEIYNNFYSGELSAVEYDALYMDGSVTKVDNAKRRVDALKKYNSYFFEDFDTNNTTGKATASVVSVVKSLELETCYTDMINYLVKNGKAYWATTEGTGNAETDKYRTQNADKTYTYYDTLLSKQGNFIRTELVVFPDNSFDDIVTPSIKVGTNVQSSVASTLNGNALYTPYSLNASDYRYRTDGYGQYRLSMPNQIYKIDENAFGNRGISEISFKLGATAGHIGDKMVIITSYTDSKNFEGYLLNQNAVLQKCVWKDGIVTTTGNIQGTTNFVKAAETVNTGAEDDPYVSGTDYVTMRYNGSTYVIEHIYDSNRQKGDNKQKVKAVFTLNENIDMLKSFYFMQNGSNYFDNFEIKTADPDKVNNYVANLDINAITSNDIAEIKDVYAEYLNIKNQNLDSLLISGAEIIVTANTVAEYLEETGAHTFALPSEIDAINPKLTFSDYANIKSMYNSYVNFCIQGLSTLFTAAQARRIEIFNKIAVAAENKKLDSYNASGILSLVDNIDTLKSNITNLGTEFTVLLNAAQKSYSAFEKDGFGDAVVNKSDLDAVATAYDALKTSGKYVDGSQLKFKKTGMKYSSNTSGSWNNSALNGVVSLVDFDMSNGIDEIKFKLSPTGNQQTSEQMFVYSYSGDKNNDGYCDISGFGLQNPSLSGGDRQAHEYFIIRETPYTDTFDIPYDCAYFPRNLRNYGGVNYGSRYGDWVKDDMLTSASYVPAGNNQLIWYMSDEFVTVGQSGNNVITDFSTFKSENGYSSCKVTGKADITMTYMGDGNVTEKGGFNWYKIEFTAEFECKKTDDTKETKTLTLYSRLHTKGRITTAGITHAANVEPETVLTDVSFKLNNTPTKLTNGASVRIADVTDGGGIRFESTVNTALYNSLKSTAGVTVELGTIIVPEDYRGDKEITFDNFKTKDNGGNVTDKNLCLDIKQTKWQDEANGVYTAAMINIKKGNYGRQFAARGYMKVTYANGDVQYFYSDFDATANVRSIADVANAAISSGKYDDNAYALGILNTYAGKN